MTELRDAPVSGFCARSFAGVREAFAINLRVGDDLGGSVAVYRWGRCVVDLVGGWSAPNGNIYPKDGLQLLWSVSKGISALCIAKLCDDGRVELEAPLARYWPEFAQYGKGSTSIAQIMSHQAGLPAFEQTTTHVDLVDWERSVRLLAAQAPKWPPGTAHGYHAITVGYLLGELARRVCGMTLGEYFRRSLGVPLDLQLWLGLPPDLASRVQPFFDAPPAPGAGDTFAAALADERTLTHAALMNPTIAAEPFATPALWTAEIPAVNFMGNARSLAKLYSTTVDGPLRAVTAETVSALTLQRAAGPDLVLVDQPVRYSAGFLLSSPREPMLGEGSFGHNGYGGSIAFARPESGIAFAYVCNRGMSGPGPQRRLWRLLAAVAAAL